MSITSSSLDRQYVQIVPTVKKSAVLVVDGMEKEHGREINTLEYAHFITKNRDYDR